MTGWTEHDRPGGPRPGRTGFAIERSCADKAAVVAADEREFEDSARCSTSAHLGHAIETGMGLWQLAAWRGGCRQDVHGGGDVRPSRLVERATGRARIDRLVGRPFAHPRRARYPRALPELMAVDKKVMDSGQLRLVLMRDIGQSVISDDFDRGP